MSRQESNAENALVQNIAKNDLIAVQAILSTYNHLINRYLNGESLLVQPLRRYKHDMLNLLIRRGININSTNASGCSAIWYAVRFNNLQAVKILVQAGATIQNCCLQPNLKLLDYSLLFGFYEICCYLHERYTDKSLKTALQYLQLKKKLNIGRYVNYQIIIDGLNNKIQARFIPDYLKKPKIIQKEDGCCFNWCCGLFVWQIEEQNLEIEQQVQSDRKMTDGKTEKDKYNQV